MEEFKTKDDELIMYCIFSKEAIKAMGGNRGKLASMAGHAYLHAYWNASINTWVIASEYRNSDAAVKVTLYVDTDKELLEIWGYIRNSRIGKTLVIDAGRTVFDKPTTCCIGFGPIKRSEVPDAIKELKLLI